MLTQLDSKEKMTYTEQAEKRKHCQRLTRYSHVPRLAHPQLSSHTASNETWVHEGLGGNEATQGIHYVCVCVCQVHTHCAIASNTCMYISIWKLSEYGRVRASANITFSVKGKGVALFLGIHST